MEERKFIKLKKEEFGIKEYIKRDLGKGKISKLDIEYTPVGEKIIISTCKPGLVIGRKGEKIDELTYVLKKRFKLDNPHIEIKEIENPLFDAQTVADEIALSLERMGNLKFKVIAYKKLQEIIKAGALGCELRLSGKLPSERAKSWRFAEGYLKKAGDSSKEVDRAQAVALTKTGIIGVKAAIMPPYARIYDRIEINDEMRAMVKMPIKEVEKKKDEKKKFGESISSSERDFSDDDKQTRETSQASEKPRSKSKKIKDTKKDNEKKISRKNKDNGDISSSERDYIDDGESNKRARDSSQDVLNLENTKNLTEKSGEADFGANTKNNFKNENISSLKQEKQSKKSQKLEDTKTEMDGEETIKKVIETEIKPEEDGTAMKIEEEIEEGVPQGIIDEELKEAEKEHEEKIEEGKSEKEKLSERMVEQARDSSRIDLTDTSERGGRVSLRKVSLMQDNEQAQELDTRGSEQISKEKNNKSKNRKPIKVKNVSEGEE